MATGLEIKAPPCACSPVLRTLGTTPDDPRVSRQALIVYIVYDIVSLEPYRTRPWEDPAWNA